jgi:hypothetical protein
LHDMKPHLRVAAWFDETFVLVAPNDQVQEPREIVLWQISSVRMCVAVSRHELMRYQYRHSDLLILMHAHQIEPVSFLHTWKITRLEELHVPITEGSEEAFIPDIAHAIECKLSTPLLQQYGLDLDLVTFWSLAVIVQQT